MMKRANPFASANESWKRFHLGNIAGMNERSVNGGAYDPRSQNMVGYDENATAEGVNDDLDIKLACVPSRYSPKWVNEYPLGALLFASTKPFENEVQAMANQGRGSILRPIDLVEAFTVEQVNYILHKDYVDTVRKFIADKEGKVELPTMREMYLRFKVLGPNNKQPANTPAQETIPNRAGDARVISFRPMTCRTMLNYWGRDTKGNARPYLYVALRMVPVTEDQTCYVLSADGSDTRYVNNRLNQSSLDRVRYVPRYVAIASENPRVLPPSELRYRYERPVRYVGQSGYEWLHTPERSRVIYIGRTIRNLDSSSIPEYTNVSELRNMTLPVTWHQLDVSVDIDDTYFQDNLN